MVGGRWAGFCGRSQRLRYSRAMRPALLLSLCLLSGCGVHDLPSCMADASTRPTDLGVRVAVAQCQKTYAKVNPFDQFEK
jgi:hypothetical protein